MLACLPYRPACLPAYRPASLCVPAWLACLIDLFADPNYEDKHSLLSDNLIDLQSEEEGTVAGYANERNSICDLQK
jgi:hypothetical protein